MVNCFLYGIALATKEAISTAARKRRWGRLVRVVQSDQLFWAMVGSEWDCEPKDDEVIGSVW